jgi:hypothetical protein
VLCLKRNQNGVVGIPIKRELAVTCNLTVLVILLVAAASVAGLLFGHAVYPTEELRRAFVPNDVVNLCIGLPFLLVSLCLMWRGKLIGLLFMPGALFFVLYNYLVYVFAVPLSVAFLLQLTVVLLSVYTMADLVARIDGAVVRKVLAGAVPERIAGGILSGLGLLFLLRAVFVLAGGIGNQKAIAKTEFAVDIADFLITPSWIICGVLLFRRKAFGYVAGLGLLSQAWLLFIGLIVFLLLQPSLTGASSRPVDIAVILAMSLICFVPLVLFLRGVVKASRAESANWSARDQSRNSKEVF